ncbi:glycoside hydrolase superfamily [Dactylonectria estremocensis]|uniref:beta-glucosidase n=1 Tax=Dactylonectria estremocensis TaxID=1079267 RepID=A0A9P9E0H8_9HYPO|nr:glycoside hydrolase superfamily [Dactylonectria estremocensis]
MVKHLAVDVDIDVDTLLAQLTLEEKIALLCGQGSFKTTSLPAHGIPSITVTNDTRRNPIQAPSILLPSATAMGATFDVDLMHHIGNLLGEEARCKNIHVLLAPTVCLQRSPLMGRGFEAFAEDPILSGLIASAYINGIQELGIAACIKHYAAHDQSTMSIEDNVRMSDRTLRELHLLPFQLAYQHSSPWSFMTSYNMINGVHSSEDPLLLQQILRREWGFDGLVMSDWWGTYSTAESINAGMDLEMPGPTQFRGKLLAIAVNTRKVSHATVDAAARNVLKFVKKVTIAAGSWSGDPSAANTPENRKLIRKLVADSIVLLKNDRGALPIQDRKSKSYGLIGDHFKYPALSGGGSAEGDPYYSVTPYDAMVEAVGEESVDYTPGLYSFKFVPFLKKLDQPRTNSHGWFVEIFSQNPDDHPGAQSIYSTATDKDLIDVPESLHTFLPHKYFVRAKAVFSPENSVRFCFGFSVAGKGKVRIDGTDVIDLWASQPPKTDDTPCFNRLSMERFYEMDVQKGLAINVEVLMVNEDVSGGVGTAFTLAGRLGGYEVLEPDQGLADAVRIAQSVDVPIVMVGLSADYESEASDRKHLRLPTGADKLVEVVLDANPNAIVVTQAGCPIELPWERKADTLLHAWYGGQETGHGLVDVLFGDVNPGGRLSVTFPKSIKHTPAYLTFGKSDREILYGEGVFIGHRYYEAVDREPLFYFGHGLSYSKFNYSDLTVPSQFEPSAQHEMTVAVDVKNAGPCDGVEVVQLYIHDPESSVLRPARELKAFAKVSLAVGETKRVVLRLDKYSLSFWAEEDGQWKAEEGEYQVIIGTSSNPKDEVLRASFDLPRTFFWSGV